jgi:hypothetical protein
MAEPALHLPNPVPSPEGSRRSFFCRWYDDCLDLAAGQGWSGWSCHACRAHVPVDHSHAWWRAEAEACVRLLINVFAPEP